VRDRAANSIRLFLVDDHEVVRAGIKSVLDGQPDLVVAGEAGNIAEALATIGEVNPDVLILDVRLPDGNGIDICAVASDRYPGIASLIFTSIADERLLREAAGAGARGYVLKRARTEGLIAAVRAVAAGADFFEDHDLEPLWESRGRSGPRSGLAGLSSQEHAVAHLLGRGMTNKQIAEEMSLAEKTVKNYVSNVLTKLGMVRRTEVAAYIAGAEAEEERLTRPETWEELGMEVELA
jgi:DNA-binding NarL/FixJ family response regulator